MGNPPYIVVRDAALNAAYRKRYASCHRQYSLGCPFTERFFELAVTGARFGQAGFVGLITANSFMKREFGSKLIEDVLPRLDLTHVIDTARRPSFCWDATGHHMTICVRQATTCAR
ncbi:MAG: hypothetical protein IPH51_15130 [Rubrivivax sp.]|nr:hypothetical protein [Rubrivivax sp.]